MNSGPVLIPPPQEEMIDFLKSHERYNTINSWNGCTSFSKNIKVHHLELKEAEQEAVYAVLDDEFALDESGFDAVLDAFCTTQHHCWAIRTNGRSGGYLVLYCCQREKSQYKTRCDRCYRLNYSATAVRCGYGCKDGAMVPYSGHDLKVFTGRSVEVDYDDACHIETMYEVVTAFDAACDQAVAAFVSYAMDNHKGE